jgi:hypothetical protein
MKLGDKAVKYAAVLVFGAGTLVFAATGCVDNRAALTSLLLAGTAMLMYPLVKLTAAAR